MIKIIKPGKLRIVTCPRCKCEFSFEDEDIKYGNQRDYYEVVSCPCCRYSVDISRLRDIGGYRNEEDTNGV